ncbi:MAG TPA: hypothetical protein VFI11_01240 [Anaerolineales bacterium]|nr:hypothetical protein [Anaerolineales bacterium]
MNPSSGAWADRLQAIAAGTAYPPTPKLWEGVRAQIARPQRATTLPRMGWAQAAAVALLLVVVTVLAVPETRAAVMRILQIGVVRIFVSPATATPPAPPTVEAAPTPTAVVLVPALDLAGLTTFENAQRSAGFPLRLPQYPEDLGAPDLVYSQSADGPMVVLVWIDPADPLRARLALHVLGPGTFAGKGQPRLLAHTEVNGQPALWTEGPHSFVVRNGDYTLRSLVTGNVLIWEEDDLTYRLETDQSMEEAIRIAESLR